MKILVSIPAYNEEKRISDVISKIPKKISGAIVDVLVVNDGSSDKTLSVVKKAKVKHIVSHDFNKGVGEAFKSAVEKCLNENYDIMVNIDADGQFDPKYIEKLVAPIMKHKADIVLASRFSGKKASGMPFVKSFLNRVVSSVVGISLGRKVEDLTCGFRAYSRESLMKLNLIQSFTYTQEVIISAIGKGLRLEWVPIEIKYFRDRKSRVVSNIFGYINRSVMIILRTVRDTKPLSFFGIPSLIILGAGIGFGFAFLYFYLTTFKTTPYRTLFFLSIFFLIIGFQMFLFALMADMMKSHRKLTEEHMYMMKKEKFNGRK